MSSKMNTKRLILVVGKTLTLAILVIAVMLTGRFSDFIYGYGLIIVLVGGVAMALMSFSTSEIGAAFKHAAGVPGVGEDIQKSALFWESASRNFWMLGILGSLINFVIALSTSEGGLAGIASRAASTFICVVYGMIMGVICFVPGWKLREKLQRETFEEVPETHEKPRQRVTAALKPENIIGYILFISVTSWAIVVPSLSLQTSRFQPWDLIIYWPSILVVLGGTMALVLFVGNSASGRSFTLGFFVTGLIGSLMGFIQVLLGFASGGIDEIAAAVTFIISSCFVSWLGMMLVGAPLEDRMVKAGKINKHSLSSRFAWYVYPLVILIFLIMTFVVVVTPIVKKG
ncbi:MAG: hypothetical protein GQ536_10740 [Candidatus Aminicenantes bacterium]|nr:hypothetical protein [Candidatus Aminicenantes bacterium]